MNTNQKLPEARLEARRSERGAALVTALLLSTLLLAAGGALIMTSTMGTTTAIDSTAELQAYYAAEAGIQSAIGALRGHNSPSTPLPGSAKIDFRVAAVAATSNALGDTSTVARLSRWLPYTNRTMPGTRVNVRNGDNTYQFEVRVTLPNGHTMPAAPAVPRYIVIESRGYGPKGATKRLSVVLDNSPFDYQAKAAICIRSSDIDTQPMELLELGSSNPHAWNGNDHATPPGPAKPAFAVTNTADYDAGDGFGLASAGNLQGTAEHAIGADQANVLGDQQLVKLNPATDLEWWLQTADNARNFITMMREKAVATGRFNPADIGTEASPKFTFVEGDLHIGGGTHGAGLMIVTGEITQSGSSSFKGLILALGRGRISRNGTPDALGALVVAKFNKTWNGSAYTGTGNFQNPYIDSSGGGNSLVAYDSEWIRKALATTGFRTMGVSEK
jgi:hypothetical protein